jgi:hypothetical protein
VVFADCADGSSATGVRQRQAFTLAHDVPMTSQGSLWSYRSQDSILSIRSVGSVLSIGSIG